MKTLTTRLTSTGWQILCPPGQPAQLLNHLALGHGIPVQVEIVNGTATAVIPFTPALDRAIVDLVDELIDLRYATGQVCLTVATK